MPDVNDSTINNKLDLILAGMTAMQSDMTTMQLDMTAMKSDITTMQSDMTTMQSDMTTMKSDITTMQTDMTAMQTDMTTMQTDMSHVKQKVTSLELTLENETNRNIRIIAEGHLDLSRKFDDALKVENEKELLLIRVSILENELRKVKETCNHLA